MTIKSTTFSDLLSDPFTPFWVKDLIPVLLTKDPVDVANCLELLAVAADARCTALLAQS